MADLIIDSTETLQKHLMELNGLYRNLYAETSAVERQWLSKKRELEDIERILNPLKFRMEKIITLMNMIRTLVDEKGREVDDK